MKAYTKYSRLFNVCITTLLPSFGNHLEVTESGPSVIKHVITDKTVF